MLMASNPSVSATSKPEPGGRQARPYHYSVFGLHVCSDVPLPELKPLAPAEGDVYIYRDALAPVAEGLERQGNRLRVTDSAVHPSLMVFGQRACHDPGPVCRLPDASGLDGR